MLKKDIWRRIRGQRMVAGRSWKKAIEVKLAGDPGDTVDISYLFLETTGMDSLKENRHDMVRVRLGVCRDGSERKHDLSLIHTCTGSRTLERTHTRTHCVCGEWVVGDERGGEEKRNMRWISDGVRTTDVFGICPMSFR